MNLLFITPLLLTMLFTTTINAASMTKEMFYDEKTLYSKEFCESIKSPEFIKTILEDGKDTAATTTAMTDHKTKKNEAFSRLFSACRFHFLKDATMAKNIIIEMVNTENTEYLPILFEMSKQTNNLHNDNVDLRPEFMNIFKHLYDPNLPNSSKPEYYFMVRNPHQALSILLAYTHPIEKQELEEMRSSFESMRGLIKSGNFVDSNTIAKSIEILDAYLKKPELLGNHQEIKLKDHDEADVDNSTKDKKKDDSTSTSSSDHVYVIISVAAFILAIIAIIIGVFFKLKHSKTA